MFSRIESWIYRICRYIHLRLQKAFIRNHIMCVTPPNILGKIYLNAKNVKVGKTLHSIQAFIFGGMILRLVTMWI